MKLVCRHITWNSKTYYNWVPNPKDDYTYQIFLKSAPKSKALKYQRLDIFFNNTWNSKKYYIWVPNPKDDYTYQIFFKSAPKSEALKYQRLDIFFNSS